LRVDDSTSSILIVGISTNFEPISTKAHSQDGRGHDGRT
jgi:hypothetical protein